MTLGAAIRNRDLAELPSRRDEDWRWTDLRGLLRSLPPASPEAPAPEVPGPFDAVGGDEIVVVNGRVAGESVVALAAGETRTMRLRVVSATGRTAHGFSLSIRLGEGARLTLLESYEGRAEGYVADAVLAADLAEGAVLERIVLAADAADAVSVSTLDVSLSPSAQLLQTIVTDGARRQRLETRVVHRGAGAKLRLDSAYLLKDQRHADLTTVVDHRGPGGDTTQLTKGVVRDQARGVFQGRIIVAEGSDQTDARMGHHALILSDRAEVDAKPELEIYADDVACSHGNTVGVLDEEALFYMRQRGIPEAEARALLIGAFVGEVVDRVEHDGARESLTAWVAARLGAAA